MKMEKLGIVINIECAVYWRLLLPEERGIILFDNIDEGFCFIHAFSTVMNR